MANEKRMIDANALMASLRESLDELRKIGDGLSYHEDKQICNGQICTFLEAIMRVREQPTVDAVEVVHGHWVSLTECSNAGVYCSVCNKKVYKEDYAWCNRKNKLRSNYCPNCGAKMDGERKDDDTTTDKA